MSSQAIVPLNYITVSIENWDDIPKAVNCNSDVKKAVANNSKGYDNINVSDAMTNLTTVGDLLKSVNAASCGFPCSVPIIAILADYQSLVNETVNTTSQFVYSSMAALSQHSLALRVAENFPQEALALLAETSDKAKEMADLCQKLIDMAKNLIDKSTKALELATSDHFTTIEKEKEKENENAQTDLNAKAARLKSEIEHLERQTGELKELADKAGKDAAEKRMFGMMIQSVFLILGPLAIGGTIGSTIGGAISQLGIFVGEQYIGSARSGSSQSSSCSDDVISKIKENKEKIEKQVEDKNKELEDKQKELKKVEAEPDTPENKEKKEKLNKEIGEINGAIKSLGDSLSKIMDDISKEYKERAAKCEDKEAEYRKLMIQYQDLQRNANSELAENLVKLKSLSDEQNYLGVSIKSLGLTITTMGKVRTIFENTRLFWERVQSQCKNLINISNIKKFSVLDKKYQIDYMNQIKKSGLNWLALAQINYDAANAIIGVKKNFDQVMCNLPGKEEALRIVQECTREIQKSLEEENKKIDETKKQIQEADNKPVVIPPISA